MQLKHTHFSRIRGHPIALTPDVKAPSAAVGLSDPGTPDSRGLGTGLSAVDRGSDPESRSVVWVLTQGTELSVQDVGEVVEVRCDSRPWQPEREACLSPSLWSRVTP